MQDKIHLIISDILSNNDGAWATRETCAITGKQIDVAYRLYFSLNGKPVDPHVAIEKGFTMTWETFKHLCDITAPD